jgi:hypothetical protein
MSKLFDKKIVAITGAAGGIGQELARHFGREGAIIFAIDKKDAVNTFAIELAAEGITAHPLTCDIGDAAAVATGKICFFLAIAAFTEFCRLHKPEINPFLSAMTVALSPYAFYGNVGYSEPLFLLLTCVFFIQLRQKRFVRAGIAGALLTATRFVGLSAAIAYAVATVPKGGAPWKKFDSTLLLGLLLIPLGAACFMLFLHWKTGDAFAFLHVQRAWGRSVANPFARLLGGLFSIPEHRYLAITSLVALLAPIPLLRHRQYDLAAFSWCCTLIPLAAGLNSMPRFVWWQAPFLLVASRILAWRKAWVLLLPAFATGLVYTTRFWLLKADWLT